MHVHKFIFAVLSVCSVISADNPIPTNVIPPLPITIVNASEPLCRNESRLLEEALSKGVLWAQQMWDASAKSPVGLLSGNVMQLGDFDECLNVEKPVTAKYCLVHIHLYEPPLQNYISPITLNYNPNSSYWEKIHYGGSRSKQRLDQIKWALCVPASCSINDLRISLNSYIEKKRIKDRIQVFIEPKDCTTKENPIYNFDTADIIFSGVIIIIILLSATATLYDFKFFKGEGNSPPNNLLLCLSARRSYNSLFRRQNPISGLDLTPMYAIHFLSMLCVVIGHRYAVFNMGPTQNYEFIEKMFRIPYVAVWISHMDLFVDSFFVMSGFLLGLLLPLQMDSTKFINPISLYIHRYLRLMPSFILVTFFYATLFYKIGEGPLWNELVGTDREMCRNNWWTNVFFLSNVFNNEQLCVMHCWYIACDFQFMIVATLIIVFLKKYSSSMVGIFILLFSFSTSAVFVHAYVYKRNALIWFFKSFFLNPRGDEHYLTLYMQPQYRAGPYILGVLTGFWMYKNIKLRLTKKQSWSTLFVGCMTLLLCFWSGAVYHNPAHPYNEFESSLVAALSPNIWGAGLCLVIVSVLLGTKTPGTVILSWKPFTFLGKLSYNIYLIHHVFQVYSVASRRTGVHFNFLNLVTDSAYDITLSILLALILFVAVETPPRYISKQLSTRFKKPTTVSPSPVHK